MNLIRHPSQSVSVCVCADANRHVYFIYSTRYAPITEHCTTCSPPPARAGAPPMYVHSLVRPYGARRVPRACLPFNVQASFVLSAAAEARKVETRRRHLLLRLVRVRVRIRVRVRVRARLTILLTSKSAAVASAVLNPPSSSSLRALFRLLLSSFAWSGR